MRLRCERTGHFLFEVPVNSLLAASGKADAAAVLFDARHGRTTTMSFLSFLSSKPSLQRFAKALIAAAARSGMPGWRYVPEAQELHSPSGGGRVSLTNLFLEYRHAKPSGRPGLMQKYVAMMIGLGAEIPKLWAMAQKAIYPVLRSKRDMAALQIRSRGAANPFPPRVEVPWLGDLVIRIAYDSGPTTSPIGYEELDTWGVSVEQALERARQNLRSLPTPQWVPIAPGIVQLDSEVSYEESMLLREDVVASCDVRGDRIFMPINRGVLLAAGAEEEGGVQRLLEQARHSFENNPWPLSIAMVKHDANGFAPYEPSGAARDLLSSLQALDTFVAYRDQQEELQDYCTKNDIDAFVASVGLMPAKTDPKQLLTWATWTEGVATWLPKVDVIAFNKVLQDESFETVIVPWERAYELCRGYLRALEEEPIRFSVDTFPNDDDWHRLRNLGEAVRRS